MHSARIEKLIGIDIKQVTYSKYLESGKHLKDFIKHKFKTKDIKLKALRSSFVDDYVYFLKAEKKFQQSALNKAVQRLRKGIKYAIAEDYCKMDTRWSARVLSEVNIICKSYSHYWFDTTVISLNES